MIKYMRLDNFSNSDFDRGASRLTEIAWTVIQGLLFSTWIPGSLWRCILLRLFGARIGLGVVIKPNVVIKFPWRLVIGDHVWIGERVWIDNLSLVRIGTHTCLSQGAYLCTGSHNWSDPNFALMTTGIDIGQGCWVGAFAKLAPGCRLKDGAVLAMNAFGCGTLEAHTIRFSDGKTKQRPRHF